MCVSNIFSVTMFITKIIVSRFRIFLRVTDFIIKVYSKSVLNISCIVELFSKFTDINLQLSSCRR